MLRVGDKVAVEDKNFDEDGNRTVTIDGEEVVVRYGHINNISWKPFRTLEQCRAAHPGDEDAALDEYYAQTITIGFDPKIGDKIIGTQFDIQNNIDYTLGLDVKGMAIPVRHSDHLRGRATSRSSDPSSMRSLIRSPAATAHSSARRNGPPPPSPSSRASPPSWCATSK